MSNNFSKNLKIQQMKALKLGVFALALGFFAASCGNSNETTPPVDSPAVEAQPEVTPVPETAPTTDTTATSTTTTTTTTDTTKK